MNDANVETRGVDPGKVVFWCEKCGARVAHFRIYPSDRQGHEKVLFECHGAIAVYDRAWGQEKHDPPPLALVANCTQAQGFDNIALRGPFKYVFRETDKEEDVVWVFRAIMRLTGMSEVVVITTARFAKMGRADMDREFKLQGFAHPFNLGVACELHPYLDVRIFYQDGPVEDRHYIDVGSVRRHIVQDVAYRTHIEKLKYGDLGQWPPVYRDLFPVS